MNLGFRKLVWSERRAARSSGLMEDEEPSEDARYIGEVGKWRRDNRHNQDRYLSTSGSAGGKSKGNKIDF